MPLEGGFRRAAPSDIPRYPGAKRKRKRSATLRDLPASRPHPSVSGSNPTGSKAKPVQQKGQPIASELASVALFVERHAVRGVSVGLHGAESEGFEPPDPCGSTVFKTAAIDHSANLPENLRLQSYVKKMTVQLFRFVGATFLLNHMAESLTAKGPAWTSVRSGLQI